MPPRDSPDSKHNENPPIHDFLSRHIPSQVSTTRRLCYRHRPDLVKKRMPDDFDFNQVQMQMEELEANDKAAITHIWSLFSAAPADQRILILKGLLSTCCMPQLSFLHDEIKPLLRIDFVSILPREISLKIFSYMDAKTLCYAAQVSQAWRSLADDDALWHRMCEQHIDKKCTKCGWGLPLLDKKRLVRKRPIQPSTSAAAAPSTSTTSDSPLRFPCGPSIPLQDDLPVAKRPKRSPSPCASFESIPTQQQPPVVIHRRPWKEVYRERLVVERNWRNNKYTQRVLTGHTDGVMCVQFCDANNIVMTGSYDKSIRIWNLETGELLRTLTGHTRCVRALQFDDAKLVTGAMDNTLKIWNWHTGDLIRTLEGHTGGVLSLHFDCRLLVSGSTDHTIRIWNFQLGECCTLAGHNEWVNCVRLCPEDQLVSASDDSTIRLWDLKTRTCLRVFNGHVGQVQIALPSPKGFTHRLLDDEQAINAQQRMVNHTAPGCDSTRQQEQQHLLQQQRLRVQPISNAAADRANAASDVPIILSGSLDNTIKQWNMNTGSCLRTLFGHVEGVWGLAYDTLRIVSGSHDKTIRVWDFDSGRLMHVLEGHNGPVTAIALSDTKIISASDDGDVRIWDYGL
ncbi:WD40 repeat-like protein [Hesseltinella vesiculosa]|uniref:WD40 repeat-like protein n=1 Tax=Hesseltinella vesiculosa TaxID=101127 RepID=A0A1X2GBL5_9FUNG|nr:WD40 repeat-like protein [Hesseltinella vesiculosa]